MTAYQCAYSYIVYMYITTQYMCGYYTEKVGKPVHSSTHSDCNNVCVKEVGATVSVARNCHLISAIVGQCQVLSGGLSMQDTTLLHNISKLRENQLQFILNYV